MTFNCKFSQNGKLPREQHAFSILSRLSPYNCLLLILIPFAWIRLRCLRAAASAPFVNSSH